MLMKHSYKIYTRREYDPARIITAHVVKLIRHKNFRIYFNESVYKTYIKNNSSITKNKLKSPINKKLQISFYHQKGF